MKRLLPHFKNKVWLSGLVVLAYFLGAKIGLSLAFKHGNVSPVWPPSGLALSALLILGPSYWVAVLIGAFLANFFLTPVGPLLSFAISVGNTLEAVIAAHFLVRAVPARDYFSSFKNATNTALYACILPTLVGASIGSLSLFAGQSTTWGDLPVLWSTWWIGDSAGILVVMPWVLGLVQLSKIHWRPKKAFEFGVLVATASFISFLTFGKPSYSLAFIHIPILIWSAIRFRQIGASTLVLLVSTFAIRGTLAGFGQFSSLSANSSLVMVQIFIVTSALTAQFVAALVAERKAYIDQLTSTETGLLDSELRFRQLTENIREVFYILNPQTSKFKFISTAFEGIWKRKREPFYDSTSAILDTVHPDDRETVATAARQQLLGESTTREYRILLPDGNVNWILDRAFPIRDTSGQVCQVAGIAEDITLRREVDAELRYKAESLARANRELEQFASIASHDLKAPLRTIGSFVRLLQKKYQGKFDAEADQFMEYAVEGCQRMFRLIEDLLKNARVGGKNMELLPLSLKEIVQEVLADLGTEISESHAQIILESLPTVTVDRTQMREVFQNLISNALKYRREEPPVIQISTQRGKNEWTVSVKDNGLGISDSSRERIFSNFVRLHTHGSYEGSGIGLATCKKVVEQRGGKIWVESTVGLGSVFHFTIPDHAPQLQLEKADFPQKPLKAEAFVANRVAVNPKARVFEILMVEDSPADSNIIQILFKKEDFPFKIHLVRDGEEALAFLKRTGAYSSAPTPELVLLDLNLPKIDGLGVLKELKSDAKLKSIPVIVITSSVREEDVRSSYDLSASCFIKKPRDLNGYRDMLVLIKKFWFEQVQLPVNKLPHLENALH